MQTPGNHGYTLCLYEFNSSRALIQGLLMWLSGKESTCNAEAIGDAGSIPGLGRSSGGGHSTLLQYSYLENPMDRGAWWAAVREVAGLDTTKETEHTQQMDNEH